MERILLIGLGGGIGSILRYLLSLNIQSKLNNSTFPFGTIIVNILGCLVIGFLSYIADVKGIFGSDVRAFLFIGLLGGFTTFSTFSNETVNLFRGGEFQLGLINISIQVIFGLISVYIGRIIAYAIWR